MNRTPNRAIATLLALLAPLVLVVFQVIYGDRVPDPLPTHWSGSTVDDTTGAGTFFGVLLVISVLLAVATVAVLWAGRSGPAGRMAVCGLLFGSWLLATLYAGIVVAAADVALAHDVQLPWYIIVGTVAVPLVVAGIGWVLLPAPWPTADPPSEASPIPLASDERVVWIGQASSAPLRWAGAVGVLAAGVLAPFSIVPAAIVFVAAIAVVCVSQISVRIDAGGLHTSWGLFGWPRSTVPLAQVSGVRAEEIRPMEWGGWGLRITPRGRAAIVRAGDAILLDRPDRPRYVVTVDNARQDADVLAALLDRARRGAAPEGTPGNNGGAR